MCRTLLVLPALALAATGLTGCGEDQASATELIRNAPAALEEAGSARLEMTTEIAGQEIQAEGAFDVANGTGTMTMSMPALVGGDIEMVFAGTTYFMQSDLFGAELPEGAEWVSVDLSELTEGSGIDLGGLASQGANDPTNALDALEGVAGEVMEVGDDEVRGVSTTHYTATIDMEEAYQAAQDAAEEAGTDGPIIDEDQFDEFVAAYGDAPLETDIWIDDDGLVRRQTMVIEVMGQDVTQTMEYFDYGEPVEIDIPAADESVDISDLLGS